MKDDLIEAWKNNIKWYLEAHYLKDLNRIDGKPMGFVWKIFQGFTTLGILEEIQKMMTQKKVNLTSSPTGSSSCQCTTTLFGENEETQKNVFLILLHLFRRRNGTDLL